MKKRLVLLTGLTIFALLFGSVSVALAAGEEPPQVADHSPAAGNRGVARGEVMSIAGNTLTVQTGRGEVRVVTGNETRFRVPGVEEATIEDISTGDQVAALGRWSGPTLHALLVAVISPDAHLARVGGQVTAIAGADITVTTRSGEQTVVHTDSDTTFRIPGVEEPGIDDIDTGDLIGAGGTRNDDGSIQAAVVIVPREMDRRGRLSGEVAAIDGATLTVRTRGEREVAILTDAETDFHILGVENGSLTDVHVGDRVAVEFQTREGALYGLTVAVMPEQLARVSGRVGGIEGSRITLETEHGPVAVLTGADTLFRVPGAENGSLADVRVGDAAACGGQWESDGTFRALVVVVRRTSPGPGRPGTVVGRAISVGSDRLTVGTAKGVVTVLVGPETTIRVPGVENPTLADIHAGDLVGARGQWNEDGALQARGVGAMRPNGENQPAPSRTHKGR